MQCSIKFKRSFDNAISFALDKLPLKIKSELLSFFEKKEIYLVNEIRIKACSYISLIVNQKNIITDVFIDCDAINKILIKKVSTDRNFYATIFTIDDFDLEKFLWG